MLRISITFALFCVIITARAQTVNLDKVIAIVNDEAITLSEYRIRHKREQLLTSKNTGPVPDEIDLNLLRMLIDERLQVQLAASRGITVSEQEIEQTLNHMAAQNNLSPQRLISELEAQGISYHPFRRSVEEQRLIQKLIDVSVNSRVTVTEQEIDYHLRAHKELYTANEAYEISHLYISTSGKSEEEYQRISDTIKFIESSLTAGEQFPNIVRQYSDGENVSGGGYLGWRKEDQLPELFLDALRQTTVGGISEILESANGFHLLKVHSKEGDLKIVTQQLIRHILIQPERRNLTAGEAIEILVKLKKEIGSGADFSQIARLNSDDDASAAEGGSLGWVNPGEVAPAIEEASERLELNQLSEPIKSIYGYHIIEVQDRRKKDITQDLARKEAQREVFRRKAAELYQSWFDRLKDGAFIELVSSD